LFEGSRLLQERAARRAAFISGYRCSRHAPSRSTHPPSEWKSERFAVLMSSAKLDLALLKGIDEGREKAARGAIRSNVSVSDRANVTAGFAKLVEEVNPVSFGNPQCTARCRGRLVGDVAIRSVWQGL
jgi:hypothetical protein